MRRRVLIRGVLLGGLVATIGSLLFGWLISWSVPAAMGAGVLTERVLRWRDGRRVRGQLAALIHNVGCFDELQALPEAEPTRGCPPTAPRPD